ncbi:unannotated protein [freshwater metagenome]|uniref:Unannotated protein n=1 Tax=freshwater metagenome TaxID=449393 RepID=A0A6J6ULM3_9ZZZZ|nr:alpha/beta fold hydrolase [Actinomycetota bacterium]
MIARLSHRAPLVAAVCTVLAVFALAACADRSRRTSAPGPTTSAPSTSASSTGASSTAAPVSSTARANTIDDLYASTTAATRATGRSSAGRIRTPDGRTRTYRVYVPSSLVAGQPAPLLVALHGGLGSSAQFEENSGFDALAEANRFVVVYPDGIGSRPDGTGPQTWNGGYCCGPAARDRVDDVGFIRRLLDALGTELNLDPARIYAAGHSNGAIMAYRLACELADRIVAIGVQAGSLGVDTCTPARPVSVIHLHGTADTNHPIDGGAGNGVAGVAFRPARAAVEALAAADGCAAIPVAATVPSNRDLAVTTWTACRSGTEVRYVIVEGATHAWMGHPAASAAGEAFVGEPYRGFDASRAIWSFLAAHPRR